jgi:serine/threonine-protein kinase
MIRLLVSLLLAVALKASAQAESFRTYSNPRFGATAEVPSDWRADPPPENGDGLVFRSPDGAAAITVSGVLNAADSAAAAMNDEEKPNDGEKITFHQRGARFVIASGLAGDRIFYRKSLLVCRDQIWNHVSLGLSRRPQGRIRCAGGAGGALPAFLRDERADTGLPVSAMAG